MAKEYVYKIVIDDSDIQNKIGKADSSIQAFGKRADAHFANIGRSMGKGVDSATKEVEKGTERVAAAERKAAQEAVKAGAQVLEAKRKQHRVLSDEIGILRKNAQVAKANFEEEKRNLNEMIRLEERAQKVAERRRAVATGLQMGGHPLMARGGERRAQIAETEANNMSQIVATRRQHVSGAGAEFEESKGALREALTERGQMTNEIVSLNEQQRASEEQLAQMTTASAEQQAQASRTSAEAAAQQAEAELDAASQSKQAAEDTSAARRDAAASSQQSAQEATAARQQELASSIEASRGEVAAARGVVAARKAVLAEKQSAEAEASQIAANETSRAETQRRVANEASFAFKEASAEQRAAAKQLAEAKKAGAADAIDAAEKEKKLADEKVESARRERDVQQQIAGEMHDFAKDRKAEAKEAGAERKAAAEAVTNAVKKERDAEKGLEQQTKSLANEKKNSAKQDMNAERQAVRLIKSYDKQSGALGKLVSKQGNFNVSLGKGTEEMNDMEREVWRIIRSDKQLAAEMDKLIAKQGRLNLAMNRRNFRSQGGVQPTYLRQAGFAAERLGVPGGAAIGEAAAVGHAFTGSLVAGGAIAGVAAVILVVQALTKAFIRLGKMAAQAFADMIKGSVEAAKEMQVAQAQFNAFFQQDTGAAEAAMQRLLDLSKELGENVVGIGRAFLPEVRDLDQLERVVKVATALARYQPEQGIFGARIALQEALSGEFRSLRRRFEISPAAISGIKDSFEEAGIEGFLEAIEDELDRTGRSVEAMSDTFNVALGRIKETFRQLQITVGEPIVEEMTDELGAIEEELSRVTPEMDVLANALGEVGARLVDIVGSHIEDFLTDFDPEPLQVVAEALFAMVDAFGILLSSMSAGETAWDGVESGARGIAAILLKLEGFFLNTALSIADFRAELKSIAPVMEVISKGLGITAEHGHVFGEFGRDLASVSKTIVDFEINFAEAGQTVEEVQEKIADHNDRVREFGENLDFAIDVSEKWQAEAQDNASASMTITQGFQDLIEIQDNYVEAQEKVNKVIEEFNIDAAMKFEKMLTDAARNRMKAEIGFAEKSIDIERKNRLKLTDIRIKFDQSVVDSAQDLSDREQDILRKNGDDQLAIEEDLNDKRLEIEQKYLDQLEKLRDKFNFDVFEAALANDAKRIRQIRRRQAFEEDQARKDRDRNLRDADSGADDRRKELDKALKKELEDARIANARKLRDLAINLDRQLEKQEEARKREIAEQGISEKRKREELNTQLGYQLADYRKWWEDRNKTTQEKVEEDITLMREWLTQAQDIIKELSTLGVVFNPFTGAPEFAFSQPTIQDETPQSLDEIRDLVVYLRSLRDDAEGMSPPLAQRQQYLEQLEFEVGQLGVGELVEELDKLQDVLNIEANLPQKFRETEGLAHQLLLDQAMFLGKQVGQSSATTMNEVIHLTFDQLEDWIAAFISKYQLPVLPAGFSLYGPTATGIPAISAPPAPMSTVGGYPMTPVGFPPSTSTIQPSFGQGALFPTTLPGPTPGTTQYVFPNVTGSPVVGPTTGGMSNLQLPYMPGVPGLQGQQQMASGYVTPSMMGPMFGQQPQIPMPGAIPDFGQMIGLPQSLLGQQFQPGAFMPQDPAAGFDLMAWQGLIDEQIASQIAAEMVRRGEIQDTGDFAILVQEKETLATEALLNDEVEAYNKTSQAEIDALEYTIASHEEALRTLREDPALAAEAEAVETALAILEEVLAKKREQLAEQGEAIVQAEVVAVAAAEVEKQDAMEDTIDTAQEVATGRATALESGLAMEMRLSGDAAKSNVETTQKTARDEQAIKDAQRLEEAEAKLVFEEESAELKQDANDEATQALHRFWLAWITDEYSAMNQDLDALNEWAMLRAEIFLNAGTYPGLPGLPGDPGDPDGGDQLPTDRTQLENLARTLGVQLGFTIGEINAMIIDMTLQELTDLVFAWQDQVGIAGYALGGGFLPGKSILVGETGPEIVRFNAAGVVDPLSKFMMRNALGPEMGGSTNIDKSMNFGGINVPDPRGLPPTYERIIKHMIADAIKQFGVL